MGSILFGLFLVVVGTAMVWRPHWFLDLVGEQAWAEKVFGPGHGTTAYQVIGVVVIIVGFLTITGLVGNVLMYFFGSLFTAGT